MDIDFDLYRHEIRVSADPLVRLSAIDVSPEHPRRTIVFLHGFGGKAEQWRYQMQKFAAQKRHRVLIKLRFVRYAVVVSDLFAYPRSRR